MNAAELAVAHAAAPAVECALDALMAESWKDGVYPAMHYKVRTWLRRRAAARLPRPAWPLSLACLRLTPRRRL